jgi:hypothetical protein
MGLLVGLQIIFWFVGGLVMTVIPLDLVRGERSMAPQEKVSKSALELSHIIGAIDLDAIKSVTARRVADVSVFEVVDANGASRIYDAATAALISPIDETLATKVAAADFSYRDQEEQQYRVLTTEWITEEPGDFRRRLPVWRVTFDDPDGTRLYVSPESGRVLARRNDYWRVFDFFWMLHIMDYEDREDFNNPLLIITTLTSTLFVFTGIILLYFRFRPKRKKS